jgi:hypothetical protein
VFRGGGDLGFARLEDGNFLSVNAEALLRVWNFRLGLAAPLRFDLTGSSVLRQRDWDEARDAARVARCLRFDIGNFDRPPDRYDPTCDSYDFSGNRFDRVYFSTRLTPLRNVKLGHGTLVNGFRNSFDPDHPALGIDSEFLLWDLTHPHLNPHERRGRVTATLTHPHLNPHERRGRVTATRSVAVGSSGRHARA